MRRPTLSSLCFFFSHVLEVTVVGGFLCGRPLQGVSHGGGYPCATILSLRRCTKHVSCDASMALFLRGYAKLSCVICYGMFLITFENMFNFIVYRVR